MKAGGTLGVLAIVAVLAFALVSGTLSPGQLLDEVLRQTGSESSTAPASGDSGASGSGSGPSAATGAPTPPSASQARQQLAGLRVAPPGSMAGYSREKFPHWASDGTVYGWREPDGSCDVRDDALIRDGQGVRINDSCTITSGKWLDPYTGKTLPDKGDVDIDHVVPLANAWRSGASTWSTSEREKYANNPEVLLSVDDSANQEKGDRGPEAWKPPNKSYYCEYARRWIWIKSDWHLTVNPDEKKALKEMLSTCGAG